MANYTKATNKVGASNYGPIDHITKVFGKTIPQMAGAF